MLPTPSSSSNVLLIDVLFHLLKLVIRQNAASEGLARHADNGRNTLALCEHDFQLLQATAHGLREAKVHGRDDDCGDDEENKIVLPANGFNGNLNAALVGVEMPEQEMYVQESPY